jgi:hypothetical protein
MSTTSNFSFSPHQLMMTRLSLIWEVVLPKPSTLSESTAYFSPLSLSPLLLLCPGFFRHAPKFSTNVTITIHNTFFILYYMTLTMSSKCFKRRWGP